MLKIIDHINIVVSDLAKAQSFFELLGFSVEDGAELQGVWITQIVRLQGVHA
ncbi:MAG: hypothetical protein IT292_08075 [Deltaproteobacteria bacterium]|nr:hypothetical protein [Deltaproteobacteria bacterium]